MFTASAGSDVFYIKIKTCRRTLLCYTTLHSPNDLGSLAFIRVVPEAVSGSLIYNTLIIGQVIDTSP